MEEIKEQLKESIKKETKKKVSADIGISSSTLTNFVEGKTKPQKKTVEKILTYLKVEEVKMSNLFITGTSKVNKSITIKIENQKKKEKTQQDVLNDKIPDFDLFIELLYIISEELKEPDLVHIKSHYEESSRQYELLIKLIDGYKSDYRGYIYYYFIDGTPNEIKIGRGKSIKRIRDQASRNKKYYFFNYGETDESMLMERVVHLLLKEKRFHKKEGDGKTEWFKISEEEAIEAITIAYKLLDIK
eukprot:gene9704-1909_t